MNDLRRLVAIHRRALPGDAAEKRRLVARLSRSRLRSARELLRLHEVLLFLRAYPDDAALAAETERALRGFSRRRDLKRFRDELRDSGIAGTEIRYRFFWPMALWLASRWPERLRHDPDETDAFEPRLRQALPVLASWIRAEAVRRSELSTTALLGKLRGRATDATWVVRRIERLPGGTLVREALHDAIDAAYVLAPGRGGPSRTESRSTGVPFVLDTRGPRAGRPDLRVELARPPGRVRRLGPRDAARMIDLAREAMVTRSRDLDAFAWGDPRDVSYVEDGDGLAFAVIGVVPERRLPLPAVHGWLTLRNGVPIGYVQSDTLMRGSEISFNTFETYRGAEAAHVFARVLAISRHLLGARSFSIEPYQLGHGNDEGLASGAWWFYAKLGFRARDPGVKRLAARERARLREDPSYRSGAETLARLATRHLIFEPDPRHPALLPLVPSLGLRLAEAGPAEAEAALGLRSLRGWSAAERLALTRLAPVVVALTRAGRWTTSERAALAEVVRAKGRPVEIAFVRRFDAHEKAAGALAALLRSGGY